MTQRSTHSSFCSFTTRTTRTTLTTLMTIALSASLSGCPESGDDDALDQGMSTPVADAQTDTDANTMSETDAEPGEQCDTLDRCAAPECSNAPVCQPCESGGSCLYSGTLRIFGQALSRNGQVLSDLSIRAICGDEETSTTPVDEGQYELVISVSQCSHLVLIASRANNTEGYVPVVRRLQMPPPVNTLRMDFRLIPGEEIRCDGQTCASRRAYNGYDGGEFHVGYVHASAELNELDNFGAIFESTDGELLWLHRFSYYEFRDNQSRPLYNIFFNGNGGSYALSRLNFDTRSWVADLVSGITVADYHSQPYSVYYDNADRWQMQSAGLTDPNIDPDGDGRYETIEMNAYQLNFERAQWEILRDVNGQQLYSRVVAEIEAAYDNGSNPEMASLIPDGLYSPNRIYAFVPDAYLRGVQTTGMYGPGYLEDVTLGQYGTDYTAIPTTGTGVFAVGQPIPKACWRVRVLDECDQPLVGAQVEARGVNHGYFTQTITNEDGLGCIEVGRSESMGLDFDGDLLSNELFDIEIKGLRVLGQSGVTPPINRIESTPTTEGSCREPSSCDELTLTYTRCLESPR